jgi:hypothetical protein
MGRELALEQLTPLRIGISTDNERRSVIKRLACVSGDKIGERFGESRAIRARLRLGCA